jgi:hypothetical protein
MLGIKAMPARGSGAGHGDASLREADARRLRRLRASKERGTQGKMPQEKAEKDATAAYRHLAT